VKVSVSAYAHEKVAFASAKVCLVKAEKDGGHGVAILVSRHP
jgi:hypothetical protein